MAIMEVPSTRPLGRSVSRPAPPLESGTIDDLLRFRERLGEDYRRDEILEGLLVVSPTPVRWHERTCLRLYHAFLGVCEAQGWEASLHSEIELPQNRDRIQPDFAIYLDAESLPPMANVMPVDRVLLVAEVVSASSIRIDREVKPRLCALAGVPFYLIVDRFTDPLSVTLCSEPGDAGYATITTVDVGEKLRLPDPFGITLDTSTLPLPG